MKARIAARDTAARAVELGVNNDQLAREAELLQQEIAGLSAIAAEKDTIAQRNRALTAQVEELAADMSALQVQLEAERQTVSSLPKPADLARAQAETEAAKAETAQIAAELARVKSERDDAVAAFDAAIGPASATVAMIATGSAETPSVPAAATEGEHRGFRPCSGAPARRRLPRTRRPPASAFSTARPRSSLPRTRPTARPRRVPTRPSLSRSSVPSSRTGAVSEIATLEQAFPEQLSDAGLNIAADRRSDGKNMFRIMTAGMSAEEAKQLCSLLWDRMVGCMVKLVPETRLCASTSLPAGNRASGPSRLRAITMPG